MGSSPHTRGARRPKPPRASDLRDHPRIRGEHSAAIVVKDRHAGSSPHTRGALVREDDSSFACGIIPAYAGSTKNMIIACVCWSDHPRIRGEHHRRPTPSCRTQGSSPHTRGARQAGPQHGVRKRIIPAYAGSTCEGRLGWGVPWDHPRIRGEHAAPPGTIRQTRWIIPAYAGSTIQTFKGV